MSESLFSKIARINPTLHGWCTNERAADFAAIVLALEPEIIVVIGVWGGRDTIAAALACKEVGKGKVVAIDPWLASESVKGQISDADSEWWSEQSKHDEVYLSFSNALAMENLGTELVEVLRIKSDDAEVPKSIGLLAVDGNHGEQALRDVRRFAANVRVGGIAYLDDLNWAGGAVTESIEILQEFGFEHLYNRDGGAFFQRVTCST